MRRALLAVLLPWPAAAASQGHSLDIEILRPGFVLGGVPGIPYASEPLPGRFTAGTMLQYERDPLILYQEGQERGALVSERQQLHLGLGYDWTRAQLRVELPLALQWGAEVADYVADGFGTGDPSLGLGVSLLRGQRFCLGLVSALLLPFGKQQAYLGESRPRFQLGLAHATRLGRWELVGDLRIQLRESFESGERLEVGNEALADAALRLFIWREELALFSGLLGRLALEERQRDNDETVEFIFGAQAYPRPSLGLDLGVGKGLSDGYGSSEFRALLGATWTGALKRGSEPQDPRIGLDLAPQLAARIPLREEPEELGWGPQQLARVTEDEIQIRDPIQFRFDTDEILPISQPTLQAVSDLLAEHPHVTHVAVEGHASEEGSHRYNYQLAERRTRAVVMALVQAGTHPRRLSGRAMGEVAPVDHGTEEVELARNRRVVFHVVARIDPLDPLPDHGQARVPWSGASLTGEEGP